MTFDKKQWLKYLEEAKYMLSKWKTKLQIKNGQNTAEYAILIALVVGAAIAMQTYAQRSIQGKVKDASDFFVSQTPELGDLNQYEPYYLNTDYTTTRDSDETVSHDATTISKDENTTRTRTGFQETLDTSTAD